MARKLRGKYPGAIYHVLNPGDRREAIFRDDRDRETLLAALGEECGKTVRQVHAFYFTGNHLHLAIATPQENLVAGVKGLLGSYTGQSGTEPFMSPVAKNDPAKALMQALVSPR